MVNGNKNKKSVQTMIRILYTTQILEYPASGGPALRVKNSIIALDRISELHVVARLPLDSIGGIAAQEFYESHCHSFSFSPSAYPPDPNRGSIYARARKILRMKYGHLNPNSAFILRYVREHSIDIVWCGYGNVSFPLIRALKHEEPTLKVVCDTDSVWSRFVLGELPYERSLARKARIYKAGKMKEREERKWVNLADVTTAVSEVDAAYYRALAKEPNRIKIFSNVVDLDAYARPLARDCSHLKPFIHLAGTFWPDSPMDNAARWVIERVLPIVQKRIPNVNLVILGSGSAETLSGITASNVTIVGKVQTVLPYLSQADVSIVPLFFESGTRFKILEAGACSIPVVSTTLGAEGIPVTHGKDILIADTPTKFAQAIESIIEDKERARAIADNLRQLVQTKYSIETLQNEAREIIQFLS
jgi:glycosyltransferase involved in cell wall biosynthesis